MSASEGKADITYASICTGGFMSTRPKRGCPHRPAPIRPAQTCSRIAWERRRWVRQQTLVRQRSSPRMRSERSVHL